MTEAEWLACSSVWEADLRGLPGLSYRRFDYFLASAVPLFFGGGLCTSCQEVLKRLAATADQSPPQSKSLWGTRVGRQRSPECRAHGVVKSVLHCAEGNILIGECWNAIVQERFSGLTWGESPPVEEGAAALGILRDIVGNSFRPSSLDHTCVTQAVSTLAQTAYDERLLPSGHFDPARLAVLADALEEAGCTDQAVLDHLRSPGLHVRGCWAVDLILAKE